MKNPEEEDGGGNKEECLYLKGVFLAMVCKSGGKLQDLVFYAESSEELKVKAGSL